MDIIFLAELYVVVWVAALTTLGFVGLAKWIWHIIASSTEESLVEERIIDLLGKKGG